MDKIECAQKLVKAAKKLVGFEFPSKDALDGYLQRHPKADPKKHWVKGEKPDTKKKDDDSSKPKALAVSEDEPKSNPHIDTHSSWQGKARKILDTISKQPLKTKRFADDGNQEHVNGTYRETYNDGTESVWKPEKDSHKLKGLRFSLNTKVSQSKREALAYQIDQLFGFNVVPPTTYSKKKYKNYDDEEVESEGSSQLMVDGKTGLDDYDFRVSKLYKKGNKNLRMAVQKIALFDKITGNTDRHNGNYIITPKKDNCYAIDNGLTFAEANLETEYEFKSQVYDQVVSDADDQDHPFDPELIKHVARIKEEDFMELMKDAGLEECGKACWKRWTTIRDSYGATVANPPPEEKSDPNQMKLELKTPSKEPEPPKPQPTPVQPSKQQDKLDAKFQHALQKALGDKGKNLPPDKLLKLFNALAKKGYFNKGNTGKTLQVMQEVAQKMQI
jgi:hypothetical protein